MIRFVEDPEGCGWAIVGHGLHDLENFIMKHEDVKTYEKEGKYYIAEIYDEIKQLNYNARIDSMEDTLIIELTNIPVTLTSKINEVVI